jgi:hypothetical protein
MLALPKVTTAKHAEAICGTLGYPSKMPGTSYGIPAAACKTGSKLRGVLNSTCSFCYACKANYHYPTVQKAQQARLDGINHPQWVEAIVFLLRRAHGLTGKGIARKLKHALWHRWHDSGDIQSYTHLAKIIEICLLTPEIQHWLPTREHAMVAAWVKLGNKLPSNLTIRISATMIDGAATAHWPNTSTVHAKSPAHGQACPAPTQGNECGNCRACWSHDVANVSYHVH